MTVETQATAFGRVLGTLMESRGIPAEPENMAALAEQAGLSANLFLARVRGEDKDPGLLAGVAEALSLSEDEKIALSMAYTFEREVEPPVGS